MHYGLNDAFGERKAWSATVEMAWSATRARADNDAQMEHRD